MHRLPSELKTSVAKLGRQETISCMTEFIVAASVARFTRERMKVSQGQTAGCGHAGLVREVGRVWACRMLCCPQLCTLPSLSAVHFRLS